MRIVPATIRKTILTQGLISTELTEEENKSGWTKRKLALAESTGLTMDHYAIGCEDPALNEMDTLF
jgi:hypothetical protein